MPISDPVTDISGCVACWDDRCTFAANADGSGGTPSSGASLGYWLDRAGSLPATLPGGSVAFNYYPSRRNGLPGIFRAAGGAKLKIGQPAAITGLQSTGFTVFAVVSSVSQASSSFAFGKVDGGGFSGMCLGANTDYQTWGPPFTASRPVVTNEFVTLAVSYATFGGVPVTRLAVNGAIRYSNRGAPAANNTADIYIGNYQGGDFTWPGDLYAVLVYGRGVTPKELWQLDQYYRTRYGVAHPAASSTLTVVADSNSMMGNPNVTLLPNIASGLGINIDATFNCSWGGKSTNDIVTYGPTDVDPLITQLASDIGKPAVPILFEITNDIALGASAATAYSRVVTRASALATAAGRNGRVVIGTCLPRGNPNVAFDAARNTVNGNVRTLCAAQGYRLADVASDPNMGQDGQSSNTTYYNPDYLHPNSTGNTVLSPYFVAAVQAAAGGVFPWFLDQSHSGGFWDGGL